MGDYDMDDDYELEYSDDTGSEPDVDLENQYYIGKGFKAENNLSAALEAFQTLLELEENKGDFGFKALKQMIKLSFALREYEDMITYYNRLLGYVKVVTKNYAEKSILSILDHVSSVTDHSLLHRFYDVTLNTLRESTNDRLWFKTTTKLAKLYLEEKNYAKLDVVLNDLKNSCVTTGGDTVDNKGTQLLEVYAIEVQKFTMQNNNKALQVVYNQALKIKAAIPHPLITGTIRECGGKMHLRNGDYEQAHTDFFDAFKNYDEAGSSRRIACLKYLVLANMLMKSDINPFDSQETKAFRDEPAIIAMTRLIAAYQSHNLKEFRDIVDDPNNTVLSDPFIAEHLAELMDNVRSEVLRQIISPYTSVTLKYLSEELCITVAEVTRLLAQVILDNEAEYRIDQPGGMLYRINVHQNDEQRECEKSLEAVIKQLSSMRQGLISTCY